MRRILARAAGAIGLRDVLLRRYSIVVNRYVHNHNRLFYTLSPALLPALVHAFRRLESSGGSLLSEGAYYEFGAFKGFSVWFADRLAAEMAGPEFKVFGFDSFEGLPESRIDRTPFWRKGNYAAGVEMVKIDIRAAGGDLSRIELIKGFFSRELFERFTREHGERPPAILVIDSDIYESAACVLEYFGPRLVAGSVLIFDDMRSIDIPAGDAPEMHGELKALKEFEAKHPGFVARHELDYGAHGSMYIVERDVGQA